MQKIIITINETHFCGRNKCPPAGICFARNGYVLDYHVYFGFVRRVLDFARTLVSNATKLEGYISCQDEHERRKSQIRDPSDVLFPLQLTTSLFSWRTMTRASIAGDAS